MVLNFTHAYGNSKAATERAQVLFKRKPFALLPSPDNIPDNADVCVPSFWSAVNVNALMTHTRTGFGHARYKRSVYRIRQVSEEV